MSMKSRSKNKNSHSIKLTRTVSSEVRDGCGRSSESNSRMVSDEETRRKLRVK